MGWARVPWAVEPAGLVVEKAAEGAETAAAAAAEEQTAVLAAGEAAGSHPST